MIKRTGSAVWSGGIKEGKGSVSTQSGVLDNVPYGYQARFETGSGTNPEELLATAHASCFTMAMAAQLGETGMTAQRLVTNATVTLSKVEQGYAITSVHLSLVAAIRGASHAAFEAAALKAKQDCPLSKVINAAITLDVRLEE